ncbi:hypothetical protein ElyMa_002221800 [Elysia marginata]|uniref:WSC domain-containing protein n=1 Tax=Elysia marginata TaxID=1093978 RepID=A0AAV4FUM8_9GAST|nr:hypothetical protein ElyMa_002221800 [Elysia marginata]
MLCSSLSTSAALVVIIALASAQASKSKKCRISVPGYTCGDNKRCLAYFLGCFHSNDQNQILPLSSLQDFRSTIKCDLHKWFQDGHAEALIKNCAVLAVQKNVKYFGIKSYGECYFGNTLSRSKIKVTTADGCHKYCAYDVGGPDAMVVYELLHFRQIDLNSDVTKDSEE